MPKKKKARREVDILLEAHLRDLWRGTAIGVAIVCREYNFHPTRKWRFDFAIPVIVQEGRADNLKVAVEIEGGIWRRGRHTRGKGYQGDLDKYNAAAAEGWTVLRFSTEDVMKGRDIPILQKVKRHLEATIGR